MFVPISYQEASESGKHSTVQAVIELEICGHTFRGNRCSPDIEILVLYQCVRRVKW